MSNWNQRYVQYARLNSKTPDEMLEHDKVKYPGGQMCGFICFIGEVSSQFRSKHPKYNMNGFVTNHTEFDKFIAGYVDAQLEKQHAETQAVHPRGWDKV